MSGSAAAPNTTSLRLTSPLTLLLWSALLYTACPSNSAPVYLHFLRCASIPLGYSTLRLHYLFLSATVPLLPCSTTAFTQTMTKLMRNNMSCYAPSAARRRPAACPALPPLRQLLVLLLMWTHPSGTQVSDAAPPPRRRMAELALHAEGAAVLPKVPHVALGGKADSLAAQGRGQCDDVNAGSTQADSDQ